MLLRVAKQVVVTASVVILYVLVGPFFGVLVMALPTLGMSLFLPVSLPLAYSVGALPAALTGLIHGTVLPSVHGAQARVLWVVAGASVTTPATDFFRQNGELDFTRAGWMAVLGAIAAAMSARFVERLRNRLVAAATNSVS